MSYLLLVEKQYHDRYADRIETEPYKSRLTYIRTNTAEYGNRLAAMPQFFDILESWLITVVGRQGLSTETLEESAKLDDAEGMMERTGALAVSVRDYFRSQGFIIRNMGAGEDGWDMCVRCTEKKSRSLCFDIQQRFQRALSLKLMSVSRRFGGHYLPGLYTWEDAKRMLELYGKDPNALGEIDA